MTGIEVLAPVRLETRFVPPAERDDGVPQWMLRVRIYPDEFSIRRTVAPPSPAELDRLTEVVAAMSAVPPLDEAAAFSSFAASVGAGRALGLWRTRVQPDGGGGFLVDRTGETDHVPFDIHGPAGLPEQLELWFVHNDGRREQVKVLDLDLAKIGADLDLAVFDDQPRLATGELPATWWLSYARAKDVGLGVDLDIGAVPPSLSALVVVGLGGTDAAELVDAHVAGGRLAVLPAGTPTNTVAGEATTDFGQHAETLYPLLHVDASKQLSSSAALTGLTGRMPATALPLLNGATDYYAPGSLAVQALWPVLWGRSLRDVIGAGDAEVDVANWSIRNLAVEGPRPAVRVGSQPYGLLPTSTFAAWTADPADPLAGVEDRILRWALPWRAGAAAAAVAVDRRVHDSDSAGLLRALGQHAPSRHWRVRPITDLPVIQAWRAMNGMPGLPAAEWDRYTSAAWRDWPYPASPIGPAAHPGPIPGPPEDEADTGEQMLKLSEMPPEELYNSDSLKLGLVGHLVRESMICIRAVVGDAAIKEAKGDPVELGWPLPLNDEKAYRTIVMAGTDQAFEQLQNSADPAAQTIAQRFRDVSVAIQILAQLWDEDPTPIFRAVLAALDTAVFRVDPWLTGIADRRLAHMAKEGAPFRLGAYGWVDGPAPYDAAESPRALAPGPTAAGLLHAPSAAQALTAAVLRDAAVRYPGDDRWRLAIDSAKVRASVALAERVRLGVHPYEALGLEVEKIAGDWDSVRILRTNYPLGPDQQARRVCDGAQVLAAARTGALAAVAGLAPDLAARLAPLDSVLDTYGDLLVADGVHALVTGRADLANAAMEAAAGLGAPPELRAIRTPRAADTVRVACWVVLQQDEAAPDAEPAAVADPAFAALLAAGPADNPDLTADLALLFGGGEDEAVVPALTGGDYEGLPATAHDTLRAAVVTSLDGRLTRLRAMAQADADVLDAADPAGIRAAADRWGISVDDVSPADPLLEDPTPDDQRTFLLDVLADRLTRTATLPPAGGAGAGAGSSIPDAMINARRQALRTLVGRRDLPIIPVVDAGLLPVLRPAPGMDRAWLEIVAAVRPRLAPLEARQFDPAQPGWTAAVAAPEGSVDPWHRGGPVLVVYGAEVPPAGAVAVAALDAWTDSIPGRRHATSAAFGFNAPKSRAPQAVLLAVPPDRNQRLDTSGLLDVVLETREVVQARATRPQDRGGLPVATPGPLVHADPNYLDFLRGWRA
jgi:hypothetical protein